MKFMNEYEIVEACARYNGAPKHPVLGPATETLFNLMRAANENSDGWCYWPKPCRAAAKLQELIEPSGGDRPGWWRFDDEREDATVEEYRKALRPIKSFRTRSGIHFEIVEVGA